MSVICIKHWLSSPDPTVKLNFFKAMAQCPSRNWKAADIDNILKRKVIIYFSNTEKEPVVTNTSLAVVLRSGLPSNERFKLIVVKGTTDHSLTAVDFFSDSMG